MKVRFYLFSSDAIARLTEVTSGSGVQFEAKRFTAVPLAPFQWFAETSEDQAPAMRKILDDNEFGYWVSSADEGATYAE